MLGELTRKSESDSGLNLSAGQGLLVVSGKFTGLAHTRSKTSLMNEFMIDSLLEIPVSGNLLQHTVDTWSRTQRVFYDG